MDRFVRRIFSFLQLNGAKQSMIIARHTTTSWIGQLNMSDILDFSQIFLSFLVSTPILSVISYREHLIAAFYCHFKNLRKTLGNLFCRKVEAEYFGLKMFKIGTIELVVCVKNRFKGPNNHNLGVYQLSHFLRPLIWYRGT